jgi:flagellar hook-basal body complex protein FliE
MVDRIGEGTSLARAAIESALKRQSEASRRMQEALSAPALPTGAVAPAAGQPADFQSSLLQGISQVNQQVAASDALVDGVLNGKVGDLHEVAAQLKHSELSLKFALEVRNKLIDAYREVMRMSV